MTSIIIFAPVLFYRLLIFRSFFALGGQLIILHGNDNGIAFFYLICRIILAARVSTYFWI